MKKWLCFFLCLLIPMGGVAEELDVCGLKVSPDAEVLDFDAAQIRLTDAQALGAALNALPCVKEVRLYDSKLSREDMEWLFDSYPNVFFGFTIRFAIHTVRTDATAFSTLHYSQIRDKRDDYHRSEALNVLRMCTRLKALDLGHNRLTDLSFLSGLTDLRVLIISPNYALKDLSALAPLTKLEYLEVFSTDTKDVSALQGMTALRDLNLACSDHLEDISCLYELPALERFWCGRSGVPREQQQAMQQKHPDCQFDWESLPTRGGWREHPHYEVIHEMFQGTEYIPFE